LARSRGASASPSRCSTTCSTYPGRSSGPASRAAPTCLDGTVTLPFILARERVRELASFDLRALRGAEQAEALCDRIAASGALEQARERALSVVAEAKATLASTLTGSRAGLLNLVADAVVERYS
jgi:geranylgeranyl pyrophosphate synthase